MQKHERTALQVITGVSGNRALGNIACEQHLKELLNRVRAQKDEKMQDWTDHFSRDCFKRCCRHKNRNAYRWCCLLVLLFLPSHCHKH